MSGRGKFTMASTFNGRGTAPSLVVDGGQPKLALGWVDDQSMLVESFKEGPEIGHVFRSGCAGDEDIKVDKDERQVLQH